MGLSSTTVSALSNLLPPTMASTPQAILSSGSLASLPQHILAKNINNDMLNGCLTNPCASLQNSIPVLPSNLLPLPTNVFQQNQTFVSTAYASEPPTLLLPENEANITHQTYEMACQESKDTKTSADDYGENQLLVPGSSCFGLPSYQESFLVDPNEILSKNCHSNIYSSDSSLSSLVALGESELVTVNFEQRKRSLTQCNNDPHETQAKGLKLQNIFHDLNSNSKVNYVDAINKKPHIDSFTLTAAKEGMNSLPNFDPKNERVLRYDIFSNVT